MFELYARIIRRKYLRIDSLVFGWCWLWFVCVWDLYAHLETVGISFGFTGVFSFPFFLVWGFKPFEMVLLWSWLWNVTVIRCFYSWSVIVFDLSIVLRSWSVLPIVEVVVFVIHGRAPYWLTWGWFVFIIIIIFFFWWQCHSSVNVPLSPWS